MRRLLAASLSVAVVSLGVPASAQPSADAAAAETLFQEARGLIAEGRYAEACAKFEASQKLDPGVGTLLNLGDCYERAGKLASAWSTYRSAHAEATKAGQADRQRNAEKLAARIEPLLERLVVEVSPDADVPGLEVKRNGRTLLRAEWGVAIPLDPGTYTIEAIAPGYVRYATEVTFTGGGHLVRVPIRPLVAEGSARAGAGGSTDTPGLGGQKVVGLVVGGIGLAGLLAGGVTGMVAMSKKGQAEDQGCTGQRCTNLAARDLNEEAFGWARASTVLFVTGGLLAAGGAVLYFTAPAAPRSARLHVLGSTLWLEGRF